MDVVSSVVNYVEENWPFKKPEVCTFCNDDNI